MDLTRIGFCLTSVVECDKDQQVVQSSDYSNRSWNLNMARMEVRA